MNTVAKPTERAPLLKKKDIADIIEAAFPIAELDENKLARIVALSVRDFYENRIASGELRVVNRKKLDANGCCPNCGLFHIDALGDSCTGCGQRLVV